MVHNLCEISVFFKVFGTRNSICNFKANPLSTNFTIVKDLRELKSNEKTVAVTTSKAELKIRFVHPHSGTLFKSYTLKTKVF